MKSIEKDMVLHVAHLSRLELSGDELKDYSGELASILSYISKLNEVDTKDVIPTSHAIATLKNVFRKDVLKSSLEKEDALKNAPDSDGDLFKVPQIIEGK